MLHQSCAAFWYYDDVSRWGFSCNFKTSIENIHWRSQNDDEWNQFAANQWVSQSLIWSWKMTKCDFQWNFASRFFSWYLHTSLLRRSDELLLSINYWRKNQRFYKHARMSSSLLQNFCVVIKFKKDCIMKNDYWWKMFILIEDLIDIF